MGHVCQHVLHHAHTSQRTYSHACGIRVVSLVVMGSVYRIVWRSISGSLIGLPPELTLRSFRSTWMKSDALIMPTTRAVLCQTG